MWVKRVLLCVLLFSPLVASGCWDRIEMNDLAWVMATGIDAAEGGKLRVTLQIATPTGVGGDDPSKGKSNQFIVQTAVGRNLHDAQQKIENRMSRQLYEGHRRIILIGEGLAKQGIKKVLDQYSRDPMSRLRSYILVTRNKEAQDVLKVKYPFEKAPAEAIREMALSDAGMDVTLRDFLITASSEDISPVMGVIEADDEQSLRLAGTAIFRHFHLLGYLSETETRELLWVRGEMANRLFSSNIPDKGEVVFDMTDLTQEITPDLSGKVPAFHVELDIRAMVHENDTDLNLLDPKNIELIELEMTKELQSRLQKTVARVQKEFGTDVFGFGQKLHRYQHKEWDARKKNWDEQFSKADVQVAVKVHLERIGLSGPPLQMNESEVR